MNSPSEDSQASRGRGRARRIVSLLSPPLISPAPVSPPSNNTIYSGLSSSDEKSKFERPSSSMSTSSSFSSSSGSSFSAYYTSNSAKSSSYSSYNSQQSRPRANSQKLPIKNYAAQYEDVDALCQICDRPDANIICKSCGHLWIGVIRKQCPTHPRTVLGMGHQECGICGSNDLKEVPI